MRRSVAISTLLAALLACVVLSRAASAHQSSVSYHEVFVGEDGRIDWTVRLSSRDLYEALGLDKDRDASDAEIQAGGARLGAYVRDHLSVQADGRPCPLVSGPPAILMQTMRFVELKLAAACPPFTTLRLTYSLFFDLDSRHSGLLRATHAGRTLTEEFTKQNNVFEWKLDLANQTELGIPGFIWKGMEHIYTGYDHIAFLIGLLLIAAIRLEPAGWTPRPPGLAIPYVVRIVTAFTVAHSLTLILAALDVVELPSRVVESAIAASILYVAIENLAPREPRYRWPLAFVFGLVHGLGFAAMLRPILPSTGVIPPLLAFNVGVELGQLTIVGALLPLLMLAARAGAVRYRRLVVVGGSLLVAAFGAVWLVERVFDVRIF